MKAIPKESIFSIVPSFFNQGYNLIRNRSKKNQSDIFQVNIPGKKIIITTGAEAAEMFYERDKFTRKGAIPKRVQKSLTGQDAIQTTDAAVHAGRKAIFMELMTNENIQKLANLTAEQWRNYIKKWEQREEVVLFKEVPEIFCRAVCEWAGVPLTEDEVKQRSQDLIAMVDGFGAVGPRHWRGKRARTRCENWMEQIVNDVRSNKIKAPKGSALHKWVFYKEKNQDYLHSRLTAIEILNVIRPTVAISYYVVFAAHALEQKPKYRQEVIKNNKNFKERFVQEVRRYYPIGPFLGSLVKEEFEWKGYKIPKKSMVILDIYGTNHDKRYWQNPDEFYPDNFLHWSKSPFDFIPQGGGDYEGHRCPGEWITIETMKVALDFLTRGMDYKLPPQDLSFSLKRIPTYPKSGVVIQQVKDLNL